MSVSINGTSGLVFNDASTQATAATGFGFKNRIINGGMAINQRGGTVTFDTAGTYMLDRWTQNSGGSAVITGSQSNSGPANSTQYSLQVSVTTGSAPASGNLRYFAQFIEGYNVADLWYGTSSASTVTLSFWVRSSVIGTYCVALQNSASNRSYVANYTVNVANTWEQKSVTIAGDQSGTWLITNGVGLRVYFDVGSGTTYETTANTWSAGNYTRASGAVSLSSNTGANFYITSVQLEKGSTATSFDYRPYGTELALCQRYYQKITFPAGGQIGTAITYLTTAASMRLALLQEMRATPSITLPTAGQSAGTISFLNSASYPAATGTHSVVSSDSQGFQVASSNYTGLGGNAQACWFYVSAAGGGVAFLASAEL